MSRQDMSLSGCVQKRECPSPLKAWAEWNEKHRESLRIRAGAPHAIKRDHQLKQVRIFVQKQNYSLGQAGPIGFFTQKSKVPALCFHSFLKQVQGRPDWFCFVIFYFIVFHEEAHGMQDRHFQSFNRWKAGAAVLKTFSIFLLFLLKSKTRTAGQFLFILFV